MRSLIVLLCMISAAYAQPIKIEGPGPNLEWHQTDKYRGSVVVIIVVSRYTEKESYQVSWKLSTRLKARDFRMFTVIDFIGIPRLGFIYNYARKRILRETKGSPIEFICDTTESLRTILGADPRHRVDIIVLDKDGEVRGHFNGIRQINLAIRLIDQLTV